MGKINVRVHHKDQAAEDHAHRLPDGSYTGGALYKPNASLDFPHTHLYQHMGKTLESSPAPIGGDHTHITEKGITAGPVDVPRADLSESKFDSVQRQGMYWVIKTETGHVRKRFMSRMDAEEALVKKKMIDGGPGSGPKPGGGSNFNAGPENQIRAGQRIGAGGGHKGYVAQSGDKVSYMKPGMGTGGRAASTGLGALAGGALGGAVSGGALAPVGALLGGYAGHALSGPRQKSYIVNSDTEEHMGSEQEAKGVFHDVDESKWAEAKKASQKQYGQIKWPVVQTIYKNMGGS